MEVRFIVYGNSARQNAPFPALLLNFLAGERMCTIEMCFLSKLGVFLGFLYMVRLTQDMFYA